MKVRYCITMLFVLLLSLSRAEYTVYPHLSWSLNEKILFNFYEEEVTERLRAMNSIVTVNLDEDVFPRSEDLSFWTGDLPNQFCIDQSFIFHSLKGYFLTITFHFN